MDLHQYIKLINTKDKNIGAKEKQTLRMPELPPASKGNSGDIPVSEKELVYGGKGAGLGPSSKPWIGNMNSYLKVKKFVVPKKAEDLPKGWTPISCKGKVQKKKDLLKNQCILSKDQKKELAQKKEKIQVEAPQASKSKNMPQQGQENPKEQYKGKEEEKGKEKEKPKCNKPFPENYRISKRKVKPWTMCSIWQELLWNSKARRRTG
ncbi:hypothetical protein O181_048728 [Austropuccinia psidii MF-1]|uniref:Uncharacterized protein n=1 Tax=Austropuccinia psidii MF-1 TaxID=1389203 RepID=A0A9Q3DW85_9BASI|nr:hypothetical protein [Austropuccinia psidii MF-1]